MRFLLDDEQREFARSLDAMLTAADTPAAARAWAAADHTPGQALWRRLAEAGVFALAVPEEHEGVGPLPVEVAVVFIELGRHAVPGPLVETVAAAALLSRLADLGEQEPAKRLLPALASGAATATLALPGTNGPYENDSYPHVPHVPHVPYALDADAATHLLVAADGALRLAPGPESLHHSLDPARRLAVPLPGGELLATGPAVTEAADRAADWAALATAAQALGVGRALLDRTVAYVKQRTQFGTAIGTFQAVKHRLADVLVRLEFARPLLFGAALSMEGADIAAAKVAAGEAAYAAARAGLQLHGAIGYTSEYDLSLWLTKARALRTAWGDPQACRARVLAGRE
ncbi:acyl-CoA dehydrogenase family protein [Streptomyces sp. NPDC059009]|uniref:acyl-CoA dehydrogenase family protein n=1 Tax=Streptomyces sp. NPDC059009 TaxID=3346694 RepID=UPI0036CCDF68